MKNILLSTKSTEIHPMFVILILLAFFGLIILGVILVKRKVKPLQIKKPEIDEKQAIQEELDRILVPVDDDVQKQMDEAMKKDGE